MAKLIIFDVDGVLEKEELIDQARKQAQIEKIAKKFKITQKEAKKRYLDVKKNLPKERKHTSAYVFTEFGFTRKEYFKLIDCVDPAGIIEKHEYCEETLQQLSKENVIVTYSNTSRKVSVKTLDILGIKKHINKIYSTEDFKESKPSVNNLRKILKEMGFKPKEAVFIGNSLEKDILPARELGIKAILFDPYGGYKRHKEAQNKADFIISDLIELVELV